MENQFFQDIAYDPRVSQYMQRQYFDPYKVDLYGTSKPIQQRNFFEMMDYRGYPGNGSAEIAASTRLKDGIMPVRANLSQADYQKIKEGYKPSQGVEWFADALGRMGMDVNPRYVDTGLTFANYAMGLGNKNSFGKAVSTGNMLADSAKQLGFDVPQGAYGALGMAHIGSAVPQLISNWDDMDEMERSFALRGIYQGMYGLNKLDTNQVAKDFAQYSPDFMESIIGQGAKGMKYLNEQVSSVGDEIYNLSEPLLPSGMKTSNPTAFGKTGAGLVNTAGGIISGYNTIDNWGEMSGGDRVLGTLNTVNQLNKGITGLSSLGSGAAATGGSAGAAGASGTSSVLSGSGTASMIGKSLPYVAAALGGYNAIKQFGKGGNAESRRNQSANLMAVGAPFGHWGMAIGALAGLGIGSIKTGVSNPGQIKRSAYREGLAKEGGPFVSGGDLLKPQGLGAGDLDPNSGKVIKSIAKTYPPTYVYEDGTSRRASEEELQQKQSNLTGGGELRKDHQYIQLADGTYYDISREGDKSFIGKQAANPEGMKGNKNYQADKGLRVYDVDYTNDLDFISSLAANPVNIANFGGSIDKKNKSEQAQMVGLYTNAWTSNAKSREFNSENFEQAMNNARSTYAKQGIGSADQLKKHADELRSQGKLTEDDYNQFIMAGDFVFSDDRAGAFERASKLNQALGRSGGSTASGSTAASMGSEAASMVANAKPLIGIKNPDGSISRPGQPAYDNWYNEHIKSMGEASGKTNGAMQQIGKKIWGIDVPSKTEDTQATSEPEAPKQKYSFGHKDAAYNSLTKEQKDEYWTERGLQ
jgi:hypothetical protein